jgi:glycosyltransferase involved in cell wall biosynthesis
MRVLLVRSRSTGGIGVHVAALAAGLRASGRRVRVVEAAGRRSIWTIRTAAKGADVVHAHGLRAGAAACVAVATLAGPHRRPRVVVTLHNPAPPGAPGELLERLVARRADVVLAASADLVERARRHGARDARFAPVAATLGTATKSREASRRDLGLTADDRLVLTVGRLAPQKDHATLLEAAALVVRTDQWPHRVTFAIAGDGPLRQTLQGRIDADHLPVRLLGHRTDVADLLRAADLFVLCSTWEARPLALQEAMRAGLPCVATAVGGIAGLVGDAAVLVKPGDPEALAEAIVGQLGVRAPGSARKQQDRVAAWPGPAEELAAALAAYARRP